MQVDVPDVIEYTLSEETAFTLAVAILIVSLVLSYLVWRWTHRLLERTGIANAIEGTTFERTARRFGTSTAGVIGLLLAAVVYAGTLIVAFHTARLLEVELFWSRIASYLPRFFIALLAVIVGLIVGDKAAIVIQERLQSVKLPEASIIPKLVKYSIFYIAALIALAQIGVATTALLILLGAYAFGVVFLGGLAFKDLLTASAAGIYLLLTEPYTIGDEVQIDDKRGIVQEVDVFVTRIESDGEEYIVPNQRVFRSGVVRIRE
jgi:small-conductance mechanosensitive channel